jgi:hypothetical protein
MLNQAHFLLLGSMFLNMDKLKFWAWAKGLDCVVDYDKMLQNQWPLATNNRL